MYKGVNFCGNLKLLMPIIHQSFMSNNIAIINYCRLPFSLPIDVNLRITANTPSDEIQPSYDLTKDF